MTIGLYSTNTFFDPEGRILKNRSITVVANGTMTAAALKTDGGGAVAAPNPTSTTLVDANGHTVQGIDATGNLKFFADTTNGRWFDLFDGATYIGTVFAGDAVAPAPSGPAGGDLAGTYPNPTIAAGAVTSSKIAAGTIVDSNVSPSAAIAASKLAAIPESGVTGLVADLAARAIDTAVVHKTGDTLSGSLTMAGNTGILWADSSGLGFASSAAAFSSDALVNDVVLRSISGRVVIQHAAAAAGLIVDAAGITAKQTILANAATPIKLPAGSAGQVLTSDASGNLALATLGESGVTGLVTDLAARLLKAGDTMSGTLNMGTHSVIGVVDPVNPQDAATKAYVDAHTGATGLGDWVENDQTTSGAVTIPMASGNVQTVTMNANVTSSTVTGAVAGQIMQLTLRQDATGGRSWVWFTNVVWGPQGAPFLSTAANSRQSFVFRYDGTNWVEVSRTAGDTGWIGFTLLNGWTNYTISPWAAGAYRRIANRLEVAGSVNGSAATATTIMTLPAGFRPTRSALERFASHGSANAATRVSLDTSGNIVAGDWTSGTKANFGFVDLSALACLVD